MIDNNFSVIGKKNNQTSISDADRRILTLENMVILSKLFYLTKTQVHFQYVCNDFAKFHTDCLQTV